MNLAQLIVVCLASASVARAYISLGLMNERLKWLNYVIALAAGFIGAWVGLANPALRSMALVVSVLFAVIALAMYHGLRWYFVFAQAHTGKTEVEIQAEQRIKKFDTKQEKSCEMEESYASVV